jgi:DNA-binding transcriptional MerR regulator
MDDPQNFSGNAADLAALAIERGRAYGLPVDPDKTNERLVRYYVTEGVVDRPDRVGRDAAYGYRHLLQLLTARRMAQAGMSLAVIAEHNRSALTRVLEEGLDKPLPTQAELLVGSFIHRKHSAPRAASTAMPTPAPSPRPSMALPDVLDEVRRFKADVVAKMELMHEQEALAMASLGDLGDQVRALHQMIDLLAGQSAKAAVALQEQVEFPMAALSERMAYLEKDVYSRTLETEHKLHAVLSESMASFSCARQTDMSDVVRAIAELEDRVMQRLADIQARQAQDTERLLALLKSLQSAAPPLSPPPPTAPAEAHTPAHPAAPPAA